MGCGLKFSKALYAMTHQLCELMTSRMHAFLYLRPVRKVRSAFLVAHESALIPKGFVINSLHWFARIENAVAKSIIWAYTRSIIHDDVSFLALLPLALQN